MEREQLLNVDLLLQLEILSLLSETDSTTIEELAGSTGLSEIDLINILEKMKMNYLIVHEKGHVSWRHGDNPSRIKPWGWTYVYRRIVGSTMNSARHYPPWSIVVSEFQLRSYGRHGKPWISNLGGVWMTLKMSLTPRAIQILPVYVPVVISNYLSNRLNINAYIKWPNDIVLDGRKIAGFLIEGESYSRDEMIVYLGIGINVNNDPPLDVAISLKNILNTLIPRNSLIAYVAGSIGKIEDIARDQRSISKLQAEYLDKLVTIGRRVKVVTVHGEYVGYAKTITDKGDLVVDTETGVHRFNSSEVLELRHID